MSLQDYRKKRNFKDTPEPKDILNDDDKHRFVVQRHRASHLHYDLRLEMEGVLKSWAVPKGPSMNPKDKRLAVHTEDHPVAYLTFEGIIPKGNYGAGKMTIWDSGVYENLYKEHNLSSDYAEGTLKLVLHGEKLKGIFTLVRSSSMNKKNQWLLIKHDDQFATALDYDAEDFSLEAFSTEASDQSAQLSLKSLVKPMLASPGTKIFNDKNWIYELKYDGYRALATITNGTVELYSRNGISLNEKFKVIHQQLEHLEHTAILDGEIVVLDQTGLPQFNALQNYDSDRTEGILVYYIFDLLHLNGHDTVNLPLLDRKALLKELLPDVSHIQYCDHVEAMGITVYQQAINMGMEGVIAKKADSTYDINVRSSQWLKFKKIENTETIICGYTLSTNKSRKFASLILGMVEDDELVYVGTCGSGFSENQISELYNKFKVLETDTPIFDITKHLKGRKAVWLVPKLVCEVKFSEWTPSRVMRHPVFLRMREDKTIAFDSLSNEEPSPKKLSSSHSEFSLDIDGITVQITNPDKLYWPNPPLTKYDLLDYYIKISDYILPYLKDRPESLHRHPNGILEDSFYQKDHENLPTWIETIEIPSKSSGKHINYLLCQNQATLLYMNNLGCIELHPWHSTIYQLNQPDYAIIDLDPSTENSFEEVIETALMVKQVLDRAKIKGFCKTSGASGLHIYIPMGGLYTYEEARDFTKLLCVFVHEALPEITTLERSLKKRGPKIYLDYLQNRKGQTIASAYSVRPQKLATVSTPLQWSEIKPGLEIQDFTMKTVPDRLATIKDVFKGVLKKGIDMEQALNNLMES
ncbi:bifunctional non-homologous end joining protein LigD [Gelidibacter sediminis]|uniref:DNA ligase (ATP) n=1 Tax=Gelidibacter sediminis TaxID=1608710 RepID=A0A4R7PKH6_9FLAO|nr:DNA ligase D [Gelidibacter sediminis]TDU34462.1 bifunctional non-homologous end joining protein LigD [Gelidibacter sediminis]